MQEQDSVKDLTPKKENKQTARENLKKQMKYLQQRDQEKVRGKFHYYEVPGGFLEFVYVKWPGDKPDKITLYDGCIHEIPRGAAMHLNKNGWYPEYSYVKTEDGIMNVGHTPFQGNTMKITKKIRRFGFESVEFMDENDIQELSPEKIVTVEAAGF